MLWPNVPTAGTDKLHQVSYVEEVNTWTAGVQGELTWGRVHKKSFSIEIVSTLNQSASRVLAQSLQVLRLPFDMEQKKYWQELGRALVRQISARDVRNARAAGMKCKGTGYSHCLGRELNRSRHTACVGKKLLLVHVLRTTDLKQKLFNCMAWHCNKVMM